MSVATSVDAHSTNRKFYMDISGGNLKKNEHPTRIEHPYMAGKMIFLLYDPVHVFKNFYNNLLNRKVFRCPPFIHPTFEGLEITADARHVSDLYKLEL